jgi:hypothetical protein
MENIYEANDSFPFDKLVLLKPTAVTGGNYFIKFRVNDSPLYIQSPKCQTKMGIQKAGKRYYSDLMFTNENENFIQWMERLENYTQKYIYEHRAEWFETELEMHDIENSFSPSLKLYKSGKYYLARMNVPTLLGKCTLKIYDERENEIDFENLTENANVITILEIQGIKCSARSFQIEIEIKQMLVLKPVNMFEKCILTKTIPKSSDVPFSNVAEDEPKDSKDLANSNSITIETATNENLEAEQEQEPEPEPELEQKQNLDLEEPETFSHNDLDIEIPIPTFSDDPVEVEFALDELPETDMIQLKTRNDVYYKMYRDAKRKAKIARDLALSAYLEAKRIKNTYMLDELEDSDSDLEDSFEESIPAEQ